MPVSTEFQKLYDQMCKWLHKNLHGPVSDKEWNTVEEAKAILQRLILSQTIGAK